MKKLVIFGLFLSLILSCSEQTNSKNETVVEQEHEITEPFEEKLVEVIDSVVETKSKFEFFDDYANLLTKQDLLEHFTEDDLTHQSVWYAEGTVEKKSSLLIDPVTNYAILYVWNDEEPDKVDFIEANDSEYLHDTILISNKGLTTKDGLALGMDINELVDWNGNSLKFLGFGWDYSGSVMVDSTDRFYNSKFQINLGFDDYSEPYNNLIGDVELNSDMDLVKSAPIYVNQLVFNNSFNE